MEIKLKQGEEVQIKVLTLNEYNELKDKADRYDKGVNNRRKALKKYYDGLTQEQKTERAKKAVKARLSK